MGRDEVILLDTHVVIWLTTDSSAVRFIAATAMAHNATLVTADKALLRWRNELPRQNASK